MYLVEKALWCWLVLLFASMALYYQSQHTTPAIYLPVSAPILRIELPKDVTLQRADAQSPWMVAQALANEEQVNNLITRLQQPCVAVYNAEEVAPSDQQPSLNFQVGEASFALGEYQPVSQTYYIRHLSQVYLCDESLHYYLTLPKDTWLNGQ